MKYFWIGLVLSILGVIVSVTIWGVDKMYLITAYIAGILVALCVIFSGSLLSGDRMRANHATETSEDRLNRDRFTTKCFIVALPNIVIASILYYLLLKGII